MRGDMDEVKCLLDSIRLRGGRVIQYEAHIELSLPLPGRNDARICVQRSYESDLSSGDIMDALCDAQLILDAVDMSLIYQ